MPLAWFSEQQPWEAGFTNFQVKFKTPVTPRTVRRNCNRKFLAQSFLLQSQHTVAILNEEDTGSSRYHPEQGALASLAHTTLNKVMQIVQAWSLKARSCHISVKGSVTLDWVMAPYLSFRILWGHYWRETALIQVRHWADRGFHCFWVAIHFKIWFVKQQSAKIVRIIAQSVSGTARMADQMWDTSRCIYRPLWTYTYAQETKFYSSRNSTSSSSKTRHTTHAKIYSLRQAQCHDRLHAGSLSTSIQRITYLVQLAWVSCGQSKHSLPTKEVGMCTIPMLMQ